MIIAVDTRKEKEYGNTLAVKRSVIAGAHSATVILQGEILFVAGIIEGFLPGRRSPITADDQRMRTVPQPADHVQVDHVVHLLQVDSRVFHKIFRPEKPQLFPGTGNCSPLRSPDGRNGPR